MMGLIFYGALVPILMIIGIIIVVYTYTANTSFTLNEKMYKQGGIAIDFEKQTISFSKKEFDISILKDISFKITGKSNHNLVLITVKDPIKPVYEKSLAKAKNAKAFAYRLCNAADKAGGVFTNNIGYVIGN